MSARERAELVAELEAAKSTNLPCLAHAELHPHEPKQRPIWSFTPAERPKAMRARCAYERPDLLNR